MAVTLRPYQEKCVQETRQAMRAGHKAVLLQMPTGGGKTITSGYIMGSAASRGNDGMFICNRVELLDQTGKAFDKLGIRHSFIAPDYRPDYTARTQIASIDTLKGRIKKGLVKPPKLAVWDECRSIAAKGWTDVYNWLKECGTTQLGLDATPERHDGKPLRDYFTELVHGPSYSELVAVKALVPFECYAPTNVDLSAVRQKGFDYDKDQVAAAMDKPSIVGDVVKHYLQVGRGKLCIVFAVSRVHSEHLAAAFQAAGVPAAHVDGDTDPHQRRAIVKAFRRRELHVLTNVDLFTAGFDVPGVEIISDACPTMSLPKNLQKWGRGSRPDEDNPGKDRCVLLDHAGNLMRHGLPDEDRTWTLDTPPKRSKKKKDDDGESVNVRQCPECYMVHRPSSICPHCGHEYPVQSREVEEKDGELRKLTKEERLAITEARKAKAAADRKEVNAARDLEELERIEKVRGYKPGWARTVYESRKSRSDAAADRRAQSQFDYYMRDRF